MFGLLEGFAPLFGYAVPGYQFDRPVQLLWFALIGVVAGLIGLVYSHTFYAVVALTARVRGSHMLKPAVGGLLVGLLALAVPEVLGTGYGWVQHGLDRGQLLALPLWVILVLPLAKILATSLSIGSGGSGGIFGPGMVIGGFVGAAVWRALEPIAPGVPHSPAPFVIVGMMACFGAIARAPLAMMLMVGEMTGSLTIMAPAMAAVGVAYLIVRRSDQTIYRSQLRNRDEARAARLRAGLPLLARVPVAEAMAAPRLVLGSATPQDRALAELQSSDVPGAPVVDDDGRFLGSVSPAELDAGSDAPTARRVDATAPSVAVTADLDEAIDALPDGPGAPSWLTVLDQNRRVQGILALPDIVRAYHRTLQADARRMAQASSGAPAAVLELTVAPHAPAAERTVADAGLPVGAIVVSIRRSDSVLVGTGTARFTPGDLVTLLVRPDRRDAVTALLAPDRQDP